MERLFRRGPSKPIMRQSPILLAAWKTLIARRTILSVISGVIASANARLVACSTAAPGTNTQKRGRHESQADFNLWTDDPRFARRAEDADAADHEAGRVALQNAPPP